MKKSQNMLVWLKEWLWHSIFAEVVESGEMHSKA
jgi:hypothetical protein